MFSGWLSYAGNELLNEERTRAYVKNALPTLRMPVRCNGERGLAEILDDEPYRTPVMDDAPWVDHDDPDTYGFCGAFPLSVSGLTDSTRTATVIENTGDDGTVTGKRRGRKEVRVTALLIGETTAAVEAGKRWLSAALDGGCDPCGSNDLCFLVGNGSSGIAYGDYTTSMLAPSVLRSNPAYWNASTGVFKPPVTTTSVDTPEAPYPLPCDEVFYTWRITSATAGTTITIETLGESGITNSLSASVPVGGGVYKISDRGVSSRKLWSRLRITTPVLSWAATLSPAFESVTTASPSGLVVGDAVRFSGTTAPGGITFGQVYYVLAVYNATDFAISATPGGAVVDITTAGSGVVVTKGTGQQQQVTIASVDMEYRVDPEEDTCFTKYARQLRKVSCISGPTTVQEFEPTAGAMETVEFSFSASPYVYGLPTEVLSVEGDTVKKNVRTAEVFQLSGVVPSCSVPKKPKLVVDPDCPPVPVAPRSNVSVTSCAPAPAFRASYALAIPDSLIPLWTDAVPILSLRTGSKAARGAQVRFMPRPLPTQAPVDLDPCGMCGEFVIDYIPANSTFTLNGVEEQAYITQSGGRVTAANHLLSGMTPTTLFTWPLLSCGTGYLALVDITTEGVERFDLSIAVRE